MKRRIGYFCATCGRRTLRNWFMLVAIGLPSAFIAGRQSVERIHAPNWPTPAAVVPIPPPGTISASRAIAEGLIPPPPPGFTLDVPLPPPPLAAEVAAEPELPYENILHGNKANWDAVIGMYQSRNGSYDEVRRALGKPVRRDEYAWYYKPKKEEGWVRFRGGLVDGVLPPADLGTDEDDALQGDSP